MFLKKPLSALLASAFVATAVQARDFRSADVPLRLSGGQCRRSSLPRLFTMDSDLA